MAEEKEVIVFEIDVSSYEKALKTQSDSIALLTQKQKELRKAATEGNDAAAVELERVNAQLKVQQQEYRTTQSVLVGYTAQTKKATDTINLENNSIQQNRDLLKQLTASIITTAKPSQDLIDKVKTLSDTLKRQEAALGDTRRNVGNYASSIVDAVKQISVGGTNLGAIIDPIKNITSGFKNAGGGAAGLSASLSAGLLGVIPLVAAGFSKLTEALTNYKPIADLVEDGTAAISAGFQALVSGGNITVAAEQAVEYTRALRDLEDTQQSFNLTQQDGQNLVNRLLLTSKNVQLDTGQRLELLKEADQAEANLFRAQRARNEQEIEASRKKIMNIADLTDKQKIALEFGSEAAKLELRNILEARGIDDDVLKRFEQGLITRAKLEGDSIALREKIANRRAQLIEKQDAEEEKAADKEAARLEKLKKEREQYLSNLNKLENEFLLNDRQRLEKSFDDKLATIKGESQREIDLRFAIEQDKETALEKFDADAQAKIAAREKERATKALEERRKELTELLQLSGIQLENELERIDQSIAGEQFKADQKKAITLQYLNDQLLIAQQLAEVDNVLTDSEIANLERLRLQIEKIQNAPTNASEGPTYWQSIGIDKEQLDEVTQGLEGVSQVIDGVQKLVEAGYEARIQEIDNQTQAEINAVEQSTASEEDKTAKIQEIEKAAAMQKYELELSAFEVSKGIQITQAIINTALGVISGLNAGFSLGPAGVVLGPVLAALAGATGAVQIGLIAAQQPPPPPKFATGVIGLEGAGTATSDSIDAKLSRGESVVTAKATSRFHKELAQMELAVGNTPNYNFSSGRFATGAISIPSGDAGYSTNAIQAQVNEQAILNSINTGLQNMPAPVVSVQEIDKVTNARNRSVRVAEL